MSIMKEFKEFAMRGNVIDLAVGVIIGASFGKIVSAFVEFVVMPPLGLLIGGVDFSDLILTLQAAQGNAPAVVISYGKFIQTVFDFTIVAFAIFIAVKGINTLKKKDEAAAKKSPPAPAEEVVLLREIRDALKGSKPAAKIPAKKVAPKVASKKK